MRGGIFFVLIGNTPKFFHHDSYVLNYISSIARQIRIQMISLSLIIIIITIFIAAVRKKNVTLYSTDVSGSFTQEHILSSSLYFIYSIFELFFVHLLHTYIRTLALLFPAQNICFQCPKSFHTSLHTVSSSTTCCE